MPVNIDCKGSTSQIPYKPVFYQCWGHKELPGTLKFRAGPSKNNAGHEGAPCNGGWPTAQIEGVLTKVCGQPVWGWSSGLSFTILFAWTRGGAPVDSVVDQTEMFPNWNLGNSSNPADVGAGVTGSTGQCSLDPLTKKTKLSFKAVVSDGFCSCPVEIYEE